MALRQVRFCEYCDKQVDLKNFFSFAFQEMGLPNMEELSTSDPDFLMEIAQRAEKRAEELSIPLEFSEESQAARQRAEQELVQQSAAEMEGAASVRLKLEAERQKDALGALKRMSRDMEPMARFGSGALDFCNSEHAIAFLSERYTP